MCGGAGRRRALVREPSVSAGGVESNGTQKVTPGRQSQAWPGPQGVCKQAPHPCVYYWLPGCFSSHRRHHRPSRLVIAPPPPPPCSLPVTSPPSVALASLFPGKTLTFPHIADLANFAQSSDDGSKLKALCLTVARLAMGGAGSWVPSDLTSLSDTEFAYSSPLLLQMNIGEGRPRQ